MVFIAIIVVKFRDRGQAIPEQIHGKPTLEIILTIIPALILIGVAIPTVGTIMALNDTSDTECVINVTGQQWWWEIDYPTQEGCGAVSTSRSSPPVRWSSRSAHRCSFVARAATSSTRGGSLA